MSSTTTQRRLRVARLLPALDFGGIEAVVALQAEEHDRSAYALDVVTMHRDGRIGQRIRDAGVPVHVLDVDPSVRKLAATFALAEWLRRERPDIVHASAGEGMFHAALAGNITGTPGIIIEEQGVPQRGRAGRLVFSQLYRISDAVVVVSKAVRDKMETTERLSRSRSRLIYNCPQGRFFEPVRRSWQVEGRPFRFLSTGRLVIQKNVFLLIDALAQLLARDVDAELDIAGEGVLREQLQTHARKRGVEQRVHFLGFRTDVPELLDSTDAYLFGSRREGSANALIEAMARATPVVVSNIPENSEIAAGLGADWNLSPSDVNAWARAMTRLVNASAEEREAHGRKGRAIAEHRFTPESYLANLEELYRDVGSRPRGAWARTLGRLAGRRAP